jgi:hypothetical protein
VAADNKRFARLEILKISCRQIAAALQPSWSSRSI